MNATAGVEERLANYLDRLGVGGEAVELEAIGAGHSNLTYLVSRGPERLVLRRPPLGPLAPSANDVAREARVLQALAPTPVPVPEVIAICEDETVLGAPFYLMAEVEGTVLEQDLPASYPPDAPGAVAAAAVERLVELHSVELDESGLGTFGRPGGYLERQLSRFSSLLQANETRPLPLLRRVSRWLSENQPASGPPAFVHGDYRLGNLMFAPAAPAVVAVLDWEMATVGDPLADLGYLTAMWTEPGDEANPMLSLSPITTLQAFPGRSDLARRYGNLSGRDTSSLVWYQVLAAWKSAIFLEGSYGRFKSGASSDPFFATLGEGVPAVARWAAQLAGLDPSCS